MQEHFESAAQIRKLALELPSFEGYYLKHVSGSENDLRAVINSYLEDCLKVE